MKLIPVSEHPDAARILWSLMEEVQPHQAISHKEMPTWNEHLRFLHWLAPRRLQEWYFIEIKEARTLPPEVIVGYVYLSMQDEIGIRIFNRFQGEGRGPEAIKLLMEKHGKRKYIANLNPANDPSRKMFEKLGFKLIQHTLALEAE